MSLSSHNAAHSVMARAGYPSTPAAASAADECFFPPDAAHLTAPDYSLPFPLAGSEMTAQAVCRQAQRSGVMARWIEEMEEAIRREAAPHSPAAAASASPPALSSDDSSAFESALLSRLLRFVDTDPEICRLLNSVESAAVGAPTTLQEIGKRVNAIVQRTVLAPTSQTGAGGSAAAAAAAAVSQLRGGRAPPSSSSSVSLLPDLHRACAAAFQSVEHAAPRASDPVHPACWISDAGIAARGDTALRDSRADRVLSAAAEGLVLALQNDAVDQSNAAHLAKTAAVRARALREVALQIRNAPDTPAPAPVAAVSATPAAASVTSQLPTEAATAAALRQKRKASASREATAATATAAATLKLEPAAHSREERDSDAEVELIDVTSERKKARVEEQQEL